MTAVGGKVGGDKVQDSGLEPGLATAENVPFCPIFGPSRKLLAIFLMHIALIADVAQ